MQSICFKVIILPFNYVFLRILTLIIPLCAMLQHYGQLNSSIAFYCHHRLLEFKILTLIPKDRLFITEPKKLICCFV